MTGADTERIGIARDEVMRRIAAAAQRAGRAAEDVQLVAVSKTVPADRLRAGIAAGIDVLGENRVQEAAAKVSEVPGARWHLVGPLQANKARKAVELFDVLEAVDSLELLRRLDRLAAELRPDRPLPVYLQVNVDRDPAKAGIEPDALEPLLTALETGGSATHMRLLGLMTVGRLVAEAEDARPTFRALRRLSEDVRGRHSVLGPGLSMGMTDDFEIAIEEGATVVRIGRAIFGDRPER